jgi:hypothetical protein
MIDIALFYVVLVLRHRFVTLFDRNPARRDIDGFPSAFLGRRRLENFTSRMV